MTYATLADVRAEMVAVNTVDDPKILRGLRQVSARIDKMFRSSRPLFVPVREARSVALSGSNINSWDHSLLLRTLQGGPSPLLSLTGVTINGSALTVNTNVQVYPASGSPYYALQLMGDAYASWYSAYCADVSGAQNATVTAVWGYHDDYANAWLPVDALAATLNDSALTFTVGDVDGENAYAESPRISAGHVLQIDDEWMEVVKTSTTTNTVTVIRGVNGSTVAAHDSGAEVSVWQVDDNIRRAVVRQTAFQYSRRGAYNTRTVQDLTSMDFPPDILQEFYGLLRSFANM